MSFINLLSTGEKGIRGQRGPRGLDSTEQGPTGLTGDQGPIGLTGDQGPIGLTGDPGVAGDDGVAGADGSIGNTGPQGQTCAAGTNAGNNPTFETVDVGTLDCSTLKRNGFNILQSIRIQLNYTWRDIPGIGNKFTGIVVLTSALDNLSCGTFVVSNSSSSQGGSATALSVQSDDSDSAKKVRLGYVNGVLKATKENEGYYQIYHVSFFGYH